ncbi:hypothetical protein [Comamonas testosteroni]|uniref:hypothetical protein n=1 Tax=Comamonas testosteroni TaxID=285 RepID=UPI0028EEAA18|nr:hypothetical protein [Comamonas testosteroni]
MDANQLMEGIGAAVAAAKPAQEYCFLGLGWSFTCLPLSDWYGSLGLIVSAMAAAGTVAAVVVALRLARRTDEHRESKETRLQRMHALYLLPVLKSLQSDLQASAIRTYFANENPKSMEEALERLKRAKKWASDSKSHLELSALSAESLLMLPEIVGFRISRALGVLQALRVEILRFDPDEWGDKARATVAKSKEWADAQSSATDFISAAIRDLEMKANPDAIQPTGEELYGD